MTDAVNQPAHYTAGGIETIDVIEQVLGKYDHRDQVEKYNQRAHLKGNFKQDLEKARWYLNRTIENCEKGLLESGTGTRVVTTNEQPETEYATDLNTETVYEDGDGDFWAYNYAEERWYYYRMDEGVVIGKSPVGHTKGQMVAFTRDFFTQVPNTFAILMAILRYDTEEEEVEEDPLDLVSQHLPVKDRSGDIWIWSEEEQVWNWYYIDNGVVTSKSSDWADQTVQGLTVDFFREAPSAMELSAVEKYNEAMYQGVFQDLHTKVIYWIKEESDWRYFVVSDGVCKYASNVGFRAPTTQSERLPDHKARQIRSIIAKGVFA